MKDLIAMNWVNCARNRFEPLADIQQDRLNSEKEQVSQDCARNHQDNEADGLTDHYRVIVLCLVSRNDRKVLRKCENQIRSNTCR
jgi:hypothetical protein